MATTADNILLSLDVYEAASRIPSGWQRIAQASAGDTGFFGAAYKKGNEIVIAFRGWNDGNANDAANVVAAYGNTPFPQMDDAQHFVDQVLAANPGASVSLTGHSLGGALAAIMAVRNGVTAETFGEIESVDPAFKSMNGYKEKILGITIWDIAAATHNNAITRAGLNGYAGVVNHVVFGDIAEYNSLSSRGDFIGSDDILGASFANGILVDDSRFGRWLGQTGGQWSDVVPPVVVGAPYDLDFAAQLHSLGFTSLSLLFPAQMASLSAALPRMVLQLTNDWLARDSQGTLFRLPYDALDDMVLDHLTAVAGAPTVLGALFGDLQDIANADAGSIARTDADINTALLQLAIQHGAREILDDDGTPITSGAITDQGAYVSVSLRSDLTIAPEGARVVRDYAAWSISDFVSRPASRVDGTQTLMVEANKGLDAAIAGSAGNDLIFGGPRNDAILAGNGNDVVLGLAGADTIDGQSGDDTIAGGLGVDTLRGGGGNDRIGAGADADRAYGGDGADYILGGSEATGGDTWLSGDAGADTVFGGSGNDRIDGGGDVDRLFGQAGNDFISGGDGSDLIEGGAGNDGMTGGLGADTFDFNLNAGADTIYDFANDVDQLRIDSAFGFADASAVLAAATAMGNNVLIALAGGTSVLLVGYLAANPISSLADDILIG
jgi:Ca2+-binding RTX toxin-like protein